MMHMLGQTVFYQLTGDDAKIINKRRTDAEMNMEEHRERADGSMVHVGNQVLAGDVFPMVIVKVWGDSETSVVNGRVLLDGTDVFWATSVPQGAGPRTWSTSPPRAEPVAQQPDDQE